MNNTERNIARTLVLLAILVVAWRIVTGLGRFGINEQGSANDVSISLGIALSLMGLLFVGCGLAAWFRMRTKASALFALYGVFYGLHWGGVFQRERLVRK